MDSSDSKTVTTVGETQREGTRRPFCEPLISEPVSVIEGNPAADQFFAVASSFVTP